MRKGFFFGLLATLMFAGCQNKELDVREVLSKPFVATTEDYSAAAEIQTKTSLDEYGNVLWKQGDQVSIFAGSTINEQYQVTDASDGQTSAALNRVSSPGFVAGGEIANNVAFYPYATSNTIAKNGSNYVISTTLPSTQSYAESSFGNGSFPMATATSTTSDYNLKFKNVLGGLKLQLKGTATIASISVSGNNDEVLCGAARVTVSNTAVPSINLTDGSATTVTLDCGTGVQLNSASAKDFVIALPPMTMEGGFSVTVTDTDGKQMEIKTTRSQTITRSNLLKMPVVEYLGTDPVDPNLSKPLALVSEGNTIVSFEKVGSPVDVTLEYKKGSSAWMSYTIGTTFELSDGEVLRFRAGEGGNVALSSDQDNYYHISITGTGRTVVSGNIMSLLDKTNNCQSLPVGAFSCLFYESSCLADASRLVLPATQLAESCYQSMFSGCESLVYAPELPAAELANECYECMFDRCASLIYAPELPATELAYECYCCMFSGCASLINAPELPATQLADRCYTGMFTYCESLINAPELPATELAAGCYTAMFYQCTSLVDAPELPAVELANSCYALMFSGCTSLVNAPDLPAPVLVPGCYLKMFYDCSRLSYIKMMAIDMLSFYGMLDGVSSYGIFVKNSDAGWNDDGVVPQGWIVVFDGEEDAQNPFTITSTGNTTVSFEKDGSPTDITLEYRKGQSSWTSYTIGTVIDLNDGESLQFRAGEGGNPSFSNENGCYSLSTVGSGTISVCGNVMSLLYKKPIHSESLPVYAFRGLFMSNKNLADASQLILPATQLTESCYSRMFDGCTSLVGAPVLPATRLAHSCYDTMFHLCASLVNAPELPATQLAVSCYRQMFFACFALEEAPELPATQLEDFCYQAMFCSCMNLSYVKMMATYIPDNNCLENWLAAVSSVGTFVKNIAADWDDERVIPSGWSLQTASN